MDGRMVGHFSKRITSNRAYMSPCSSVTLANLQEQRRKEDVYIHTQQRMETPIGGTGVLCKMGNEV